MIRILFLTSLLLCGGPAFAQDDAAARFEAAERYIASPSQQDMITAMFSPEAVLGQMQAGGGGMTPEQLQVASKIVTEEIGKVRPLIENALIKAVAETFSLDQIEAVDAFYRTPEGAAVLRKTQPMMGNFWNRVGPVLRQSQRNTNERLKRELQ
ncbi:MAG: DUF2059 domain-containing protein [Pseudomonadota bacterium]